MTRERVDPQYWRETKATGAGPLGPDPSYVEELERKLARVREEAEAFASCKLGPPTEDGYQYVKRGHAMADRILAVLDGDKPRRGDPMGDIHDLDGLNYGEDKQPLRNSPYLARETKRILDGEDE